MTRKACIFIFHIALLISTNSFAADMTIDRQCGANYCDFILTGKITKQTPDLLRKATIDMHGSVVVLESPGGSLTAGLELGRVIRENGLRTRVGNSDLADSINEHSNTCLSACAYAFLGGLDREVEEGAKLGFHRFSISRDKDKLVSANSAINVAQDLSSTLVSYVLEMGIDARIFTDASKAQSDQMHFPKRQIMLDYEVITPSGFSQFSLRAARSGIVADSNRQHASNKYQNLNAFTAYCEQGTPKLLFTTDIKSLEEWGPALLYITYYKGAEVFYETIEASAVSVQSFDNGVYLVANIAKSVSEKLAVASKIETAFDYPNAAGGQYEFHLDLNDNDRISLEAAFRLCI